MAERDPQGRVDPRPGGDRAPRPEALPNVYGRELSAAEIAAGEHRELVGGLWDEAGPLQLELLAARGLRPSMRLLDLGCGCLRGGVHLVRFLDPGHYFGIDVNESLLAAGRLELERAGLGERLPAANLRRDGDLEGWRFGVDFDVVLAHSLFTHLPPPWLRHGLRELTRCVRGGGRFYVTYFERPPDWPPDLPLDHRPGGVRSYPDRDPFDYRVADLRRAAEGLPWALEVIGAWGHPRDQRLALYTRLPGSTG